MAWTLNPFALPELLVGALALAAAAFVYRARPRARENRALALFLFIVGLAQFFGAGVRFLTTDRDVAFSLWVVRVAFYVLSLGPLLLFYGTLPGAVARPFRSRGARIAGPAAALAGALLVVERPDLFLAQFFQHPVTGTWVGGDGPWFGAMTLLSALVYLLGLPVTLAAIPAAVTELERRKARALALAFGVFAVVQGVTVLLIGFGTAFSWALRGVADVAFLALPIGALLFLALLALGVLRAQVLDLDLRLRWTVRHGTVAGAFVAVFFVASEGAQALLAEEIGPLAGILAAGALVFVLAPLQRTAERISAAAVPGARAEPADRDERRRQIYRAAVESAARDGVVTDRERDVLATLQEQLGIAATEALAIERDVVAAPAAPSPRG